MEKLYCIKVRKNSEDKPLLLHFSSRRKMEKMAFALKREGFKVTGEYDHAIKLNQDLDDALETAKVFLGTPNKES